jgi:hypothetical protein
MKVIPESGIAEIVKAELNVPDPPIHKAVGILNETNKSTIRDDSTSN